MKKILYLIVAGCVSCLPAMAEEKPEILFEANFDQGTSANIANAEGAMLRGSAVATSDQSGRNGGEALQVGKEQDTPYRTAEYDRFQNIVFSEGTVELWYRPDFEREDPRALRYLFDLPSDALSGQETKLRTLLVLTGNEGELIFRAFVGDPENQQLVASVGWIAGEWHHIALTWDEQEARLFLDGRRVASLPIQNGLFSGEQDVLDQVSTSFGIGGLIHSDGSVSADGLIDDVRIWNKAIYLDDFTPDAEVR